MTNYQSFFRGITGALYLAARFAAGWLLAGISFLQQNRTIGVSFFLIGIAFYLIGFYTIQSNFEARIKDVAPFSKRQKLVLLFLGWISVPMLAASLRLLTGK